MKLFDSIWAFRTKGQLPVAPGSHAKLGATISSYGWYWLFLGIVMYGLAAHGGVEVPAGMASCSA